MLGVLQSLWYQKDQNHYLDQHNQRRNRDFIPATGLCPKGVSGGKNKDAINSKLQSICSVLQLNSNTMENTDKSPFMRYFGFPVFYVVKLQIKSTVFVMSCMCTTCVSRERQIWPDTFIGNKERINSNCKNIRTKVNSSFLIWRTPSTDKSC